MDQLDGSNVLLAIDKGYSNTEGPGLWTDQASMG